MIDIVKKTFTESGLSIRKLAIRAGIPYSSVHGFLVNNKSPQTYTLARICEALNLKLVKGKDN